MSGAMASQRRTALETIDRLEEDHGAPLGAVVEDLAGEFGAHDALEVLARLKREGQAYSPSDTTLRLLVSVDDLDRGPRRGDADE